MDMAQYTLLQTEKSYRLEQANVFTLVFVDATIQPNKIELKKMLLADGYTPLAVTIVHPYTKEKTRGKKRNKVSQARPTKYYVTLKPGEKIVQQEDTQLTQTN